jgi:hypothetical protein
MEKYIAGVKAQKYAIYDEDVETEVLSMDKAELEKIAAEPDTETADEGAEDVDIPSPKWDEELLKMRALFREEI